MKGSDAPVSGLRLGVRWSGCIRPDEELLYWTTRGMGCILEGVFFLVSARMEEAAFNHVLETGLTHELKKGLPRYKDVPFSSGLPHL